VIGIRDKEKSPQPPLKKGGFILWDYLSHEDSEKEGSFIPHVHLLKNKAVLCVS
jgi:hypothetical protein